MPWVRLDDTFPEHPKVEQVGPLAGWLHVCALCYCNRNLTDGFIPAARVPKLADIPKPSTHVRQLIRAGMWLETEGGYQIHDFLKYQPSKAKVEAEREAAKERMAAIRAAKKGQDASDDSDPFMECSAEVLPMFGRTSPERSPELRLPRPVPSASSKTPPIALAFVRAPFGVAGGFA